ncbi:hypothetical protein D5041_04985 [Verminephrobacter aporrectodeae subsp. tuberculatae]|uniref:hypothetical protein n=1 Tax=Verminephrobacter aporrectodeae TaxID=1110389 RepID=UPI0022388112|nr:hypothetical protein [Verminephrobacter aporrectodeae]MCW5222971.1 hypothetical protein [Verminephrobacter aporrectodeae subsp. tuberculatae]MCW5288435.1 hypothetical protein [Verminephrobacter aporrectodeae subsp. tuberculatae]
MIPTAFSLFALRELPFTRADFPRWQSVLAISLIGVLAGLDPSLRAVVQPLWLAVFVGQALAWPWFLVIVAMLRWWMKRGGRWDGNGDLFNLVAASWLVADTLSTGLAALGVSPLLILPLWLYSIWVTGNALAGAIPKASLGYSIAGIVIGLALAFVASVLVVSVVSVVMAMMGLVPGEAGT